MKLIQSCFIFLVIGCTSASIEFQGKGVGEASIDGLTYSVFRNGNDFQVIRTGYADSRRQRRVEQEMHQVVRDVTSCEISSKKAKGDLNVLTGTLVC
jgi:hypothetical protein